jgi:hypothetical protein
VCNLLNPRIYISDICFSAHHSSWTCVYNNFLQNEIYKILKIYNDNLTRLFALLKRYQITEEIKKSRFPYSPLLFYWQVFIFWSFLKQRRDCSSRVHALLDLSVLWEKRLFSYWNRIRLETTNKQSISSLVIFIAKLSSVQKMARSDDVEEGVCAICFSELLSVKPWCRFLCIILTLTRGAICVMLSAVLLLSVPLEDPFPVFEVLLTRLLPVAFNKEIFVSYLIISNSLTWSGENVLLFLKSLHKCIHTGRKNIELC